MDSIFSKDNILIMAKDDSKKAGNDYNSILTLLKDLSTFQTSVGECMSQQTDPNNQGKIEEFYTYLDQMSDALLSMARASLKSSRRQHEQMMGESMGDSETEVERPVSKGNFDSSVKPPLAPSSPLGR